MGAAPADPLWAQALLRRVKCSLRIAFLWQNEKRALRENAEMFAQNFAIFRGFARQIARTMRVWSL
jgi:hypothetical protein